VVQAVGAGSSPPAVIGVRRRPHTSLVNDGVELIGGQEKREICMVAPDSSWPQRFRSEQARIMVALGAVALRVDHIGSTSVAGLVAKPIIDIDVSVSDPDDEVSYLPHMLAAGYLLRVREPGHRMFRTPDLDVHVHVCAQGSQWERRHLLFRDWLRHNERDRAAYGQLKTDLARREWSDMNAYAAAKGPLIAAITERAERWAGAGGWVLST